MLCSLDRLPTYIVLLLLISPSVNGQQIAEAVITKEQSSERCAALALADFSQVPDAPTQITSANGVPSEGDLPAYCQVYGYISPAVGFELRLPTNRWNEKFLEMGCGGLCGVMFSSYGRAGHDCDVGLRKGYACVATNQGHAGTMVDGLWAYHDLQAQIDFALRAAHVAAIAGKAVTERYYAQAPRKAYFWGCSGGGRAGMVEAQQFPWDFDGIAVVAPSFHHPDSYMSLLWNWKVATQDGKALFTPADVSRLHAAAVAQCDADDGLKDGIIGNPKSCHFDPAKLACTGGRTARCLSTAQTDAARKIYAGIRNSKGELLFPGMVPGEEDLIPTDARPVSLWTDFFRYFGFDPAPGSEWKPADFDFDRDPKRLGIAQALLAAANPDLRPLKKAGGKLILAHGWADDSVLPLVTVDYYDAVLKLMGDQTQGFFRLFMVPGMGHCSGGDGAYAIDYLTALENWVERQQAPDVLIGAHVRSDRYSGWADLLPADPSDVAFTRPIYPYPLRARYRGKGDPNLASSFEPTTQ